MRTRALVTGGAGFVGAHLTRALLTRGVEVIVLDDLSVGKRENVPSQARLVVGDVCSQEDVKAAIDGVTVVFHQAARVSIRSSIKQFYADADTNFMGTLNLLRNCSGTSVERFVFASSMAVYGDSPSPSPIAEDFTMEPISPYGVAKLAAEKYCMMTCRDLNIDCQILRYFNIFGPGQTFTPYVGVVTIFVERLLQGQAPVIFGDGEQRRDFVHVSDVINANLLAMDTNDRYGLFNVGTGVATSVNEIATLLCERINANIRLVYASPQAGELRNSIADIGRISHTLGFVPQVTLAEKIDEVIESIKRTKGLA